MTSAKQFIELGMIELLVRIVLVSVGLGALLLAYVGALAAGVPRRGRGFSAVFLHALPLAIVISILLATVAALANPDDMVFSKPCHLTGNYSLMMVDAESPGWVYKDTNGFQNIDWKKDGIDGVESLQVVGKYIVGGRDTRGFRKNASVNEYFLIDTDKSSLSHFETRSQLESAVTPLGIRVQLESAYGLYADSQQSQSRGLVVLNCVLGALCLGLFFRWTKKLKTLRSTEVAT
jgi:hypothetical protein